LAYHVSYHADFFLGMQLREIKGGRPLRFVQTVVDCSKFRSKIGLDVALEALRDCLKQLRATIEGRQEDPP
jgi:hypothetical protein